MYVINSKKIFFEDFKKLGGIDYDAIQIILEIESYL